MFLTSLSYEEYAGQPRHWQLDKLSLGQINLIVGQNSSGKTRAINVIFALSRLIGGKLNSTFDSGTWKAEFSRKKGQFVEAQAYSVEFRNRIVASEHFSIRDLSIMERSSDGNGFVVKKSGHTKVRYKVPPNQLMAVVRRDEIQHPFFEQIHAWGRDACIYRFGSDFGKSNASLRSLTQRTEEEALQPSDNVDNAAHVFLKSWERFGKQFADLVKSDMYEMGYPCSSVELKYIDGVVVNGNAPLILCVQETGLPSPTLQNEMSQGMYRALAISIHVNASILWATATRVGHSSAPLPLVAIDDIGEGLDYDRSRRLIKLLIQKAQEHEFQLIMSSNDRFIMNDVPLMYWTILHRSGGRVKAYNYENSKEIFDEFRYLGLNNFDFFAGSHFLEPAQK